MAWHWYKLIPLSIKKNYELLFTTNTGQGCMMVMGNNLTLESILQYHFLYINKKSLIYLKN